MKKKIDVEKNDTCKEDAPLNNFLSSLYFNIFTISVQLSTVTTVMINLFSLGWLFCDGQNHLHFSDNNLHTPDLPISKLLFTNEKVLLNSFKFWHFGLVNLI